MCTRSTPTGPCSSSCGTGCGTAALTAGKNARPASTSVSRGQGAQWGHRVSKQSWRRQRCGISEPVVEGPEVTTSSGQGWRGVRRAPLAAWWPAEGRDPPRRPALTFQHTQAALAYPHASPNNASRGGGRLRCARALCAAKDIMIPTGEMMCGPLCGYDLEELRRKSIWSLGEKELQVSSALCWAASISRPRRCSPSARCIAGRSGAAAARRGSSALAVRQRLFCKRRRAVCLTAEHGPAACSYAAAAASRSKRCGASASTGCSGRGSLLCVVRRCAALAPVAARDAAQAQAPAVLVGPHCLALCHLALPLHPGRSKRSGASVSTGCSGRDSLPCLVRTCAVPALAAARDAAQAQAPPLLGGAHPRARFRRLHGAGRHLPPLPEPQRLPGRAPGRGAPGQLCRRHAGVCAGSEAGCLHDEDLGQGS